MEEASPCCTVNSGMHWDFATICVEGPGEFQFQTYLCRLVDVLVLMHSLDFLLIYGHTTEKALGVHTR